MALLTSLCCHSVELFLDVMAEGFGWEPAWREAAKDRERRALKQPNYHPFLAYCEGEPAATGVLKTNGDLGKRGRRPRPCHISGASASWRCCTVGSSKPAGSDVASW
jgi:hypothetical protein